jgi:1-phosphofructokinase family hexose kinase
MITSVTLNPCIDETLFVDGLLVHDRNEVRLMEVDAGGKGVNLSRIVAELSGETVALGFLGGGPGAFIRQVLDRQGVRHDFTELEHDTRTNILVEDGSGNPPTVFTQRGPNVTEVDWKEFYGTFDRWLRQSKWLAIGGSVPPGIGPTHVVSLGLQARALGVPWFLDADGDLFAEGLKAGPELIKPNRDEAARWLGANMADPSDALAAARRLIEAQRQGGASDPTTVVSLGSEGAVLARAEGVWVGSPIRIEPKSTIGSGDSMVGAMLQRRCLGDSWPEALAWGLAAGAATAMTDGTQIGRRADIERLAAQARVERVS